MAASLVVRHLRSNGNHNITDDYTYNAFDSHTCDNMISLITDAVMAINDTTAIMFLVMATMPTAVVVKQIWLKIWQ